MDFLIQTVVLRTLQSFRGLATCSSTVEHSSWSLLHQWGISWKWVICVTNVCKHLWYSPMMSCTLDPSYICTALLVLVVAQLVAVFLHRTFRNWKTAIITDPGHKTSIKIIKIICVLYISIAVQTVCRQIDKLPNFKLLDGQKEIFGQDDILTRWKYDKMTRWQDDNMTKW